MRDAGFYNMCENGNILGIEELLKSETKLGNLWKFSFNWGLANACRGGHLQVVERMIELGANDFNWGLCGACYGGHLQILERMIELSNLNGVSNQNYFNGGLLYACEDGHLQIAEKMIKLGAKFSNNEKYRNLYKHEYIHKYKDYLRNKKIMNKLLIMDLINEIMSYI